MRVAVSIPDAVVAEADALARQLRTTRSDVYARALRAYVAERAEDPITAAMNAVIDEVGTEVDPFVRAASRNVLKNTQW